MSGDFKKDPNYWSKRSFDRQDELHLELLRASISDAKEAIRASFFLNGAACIAVLGFLSSMISSSESKFGSDLLEASQNGLWWFSIGTLLSAIASGMAYLCNSCYSASAASVEKNYSHPFIRDTDESRSLFRKGRIANWVAIIIISASYISFLIGILKIGVAM
ncbi:hypothetical protein [Breoghania sp.]|uniref:hypothetical protein n=1 Tax=Breoghania sp. TaxID=2065378 RepID=UPI002AA6172B|nr:hypothetical protein [Breoghania sp.]